MDITSYLLGKKSSGGGGSSIDWSQIGYESQPEAITDDFNYSKNIYDNWDSSATSINQKYRNDGLITYFPLVDASNVTSARSTFEFCYALKEVAPVDFSELFDAYNMFHGCTSLRRIPQFKLGKLWSMQLMFQGCTNLKDVPVLDTTSVKHQYGFGYTFYECPSLTDQSLDNILQMCINATSYTGTKTLYNVGIQDSTIYPANRIQALPHYQDFIDAGWTIS